MDKVKDIDNGFNHGISIVERKSVVISGVKKIESFDNEEFLMETTLGFLAIKGGELEIIKLDTYQGNVSIKGKIDSIVYTDNVTSKNKEESFFKVSINFWFAETISKILFLTTVILAEKVGVLAAHSKVLK